MSSKPYVLTWRSDIDPGSIKIVGPFESESWASSWGRVWQKAHQDNPCWQVLTLADSDFGEGLEYLCLKVARPGTPEASA